MNNDTSHAPKQGRTRMHGNQPCVEGGWGLDCSGHKHMVRSGDCQCANVPLMVHLHRGRRQGGFGTLRDGHYKSHALDGGARVVWVGGTLGQWAVHRDILRVWFRSFPMSSSSHGCLASKDCLIVHHLKTCTRCVTRLVDVRCSR